MGRMPRFRWPKFEHSFGTIDRAGRRANVPGSGRILCERTRRVKRTRPKADAEHYWIYDYRDAVWASALPPNAKLVTLAMSIDADWGTGKNCRPGMRRLRDLTGLSERTITRVRQECVRAGWMELIETGSRKGGGHASTYDLTIPTHDTLAGVELSTPDTETGVTRAPVAGVPDSTPAKSASTPANRAGDPCQVGDPPLLTTYDHAPAPTISETHRRVSAKALKAIRAEREAS